jgi:DNA gyrase subunit A
MVALNGGKPELMTLIDMLKAFVSFREDVITRRTKFLLAQGARTGACAGWPRHRGCQYRRSHCTDPQCARSCDRARAIDERRWPAMDVEALIRLIDDPRHRINEDGTYNLSEEQARAILELRLPA